MSQGYFEASPPSAGSPPRAFASIVLLTLGRLIVHFFAAVIVLIVLCGCVPTIWAYYEQENWKVPVVTAHVYTAYHRMNGYWYLLIPAFLGIDAIVLVALESCKQPVRYLAKAWFIIVLFAALLSVAWINIGMALPFSAYTLEESDAEPAMIVE